MHSPIVPDNLNGLITAFFTGKQPGCDLQEIGRMHGIAKERIYLPVQKHTDKVIVLDADLEPKIADAVVTRRRDVLIGVRTADCVPILVFDAKGMAVGAVHAGWRGTADAVLLKTLRRMDERFGTSPSDCLIAIGPSIRWCCYPVGPEVVRAVRMTAGEGEYIVEKGGKTCLDLPRVNRQQALSAGVPGKNIWISDACTFCQPDAFFSYRYSRGTTGRQGGFIGML